jgi:hypothetical protein
MVTRTNKTMKQYKQILHSPWCNSINGSLSLPCNCPASEEITSEIFACKCGKDYGTKQGLLTHQRMVKHLPKL